MKSTDVGAHICTTFNISGDIYLIKVNNENTEAMFEISSKLTLKTPEQQQSHRSGAFTVNFE